MESARFGTERTGLRLWRHIMGALFNSFRRSALAGLGAALAAILATEVVSDLNAGTVLPPPQTQLVAAALAISLGYSVALTVLTFELLGAGVAFLRHVEPGAAAEARHPTAKRAKRLGRSSGRYEAPSFRTRAVPPSAADASAMVPSGAGPDRLSDQPVPGKPVPASRLPRIEWAYEDPIPPLPMKQPEPTRATSTHASGRDTQAAIGPRIVPVLSPRDVPPAPIAREPGPAAPTRPLPRETRPLPRTTVPLREVPTTGLWGRVSQALIGGTGAQSTPESAESPQTNFPEDERE